MSAILKQSSAKCCWCGGLLYQIEGSAPVWWCLTQACAQEQTKWGISRNLQQWGKDKDGNNTLKNTWERLFIPTPRQVQFMSSKAKYRLFGGAAGPGKSTAARIALYRKALAIPGFEALILRETFPELEKTHLRKMANEVAWFGDRAQFIESKRLMKFHHPNGPDSLIECGHMDDDKALQKYLSTEYDEIVPDEGSRYDPDRLLELSTRARSSKPAVVAAGGPWFDVVSNPGGRAAMMLRDLFIRKEVDPDRYPVLSGVDEHGVPFYDPNEWEYIPATLDDNPYIDPSYVRTLAVIPQAWRYQQLRHGDWEVFAGAFFSNWIDRKHTRELRIRDPRQASWSRSLDFGFHDPTVIGWFVALPDGRYHCVAELKLKETLIVDIVREVQAMDRALGLPSPVSSVRTYADPSVRQRSGQTGESILETFGKCGMPLIPSVNERVNGWMRVQALLKDSPPLPTDYDTVQDFEADKARYAKHEPMMQGIPYLTFAPECKYLRRSMAAAISDEKSPDDIDQSMDDHGLDSIRYWAMSRAMPRHPSSAPRPGRDSAGALMAEAISDSQRVA